MAASRGSVTSSARFTPRRLSSHPASATAPGPNFTSVASRVNTDSRSAGMGPACPIVRGLDPVSLQ